MNLYRLALYLSAPQPCSYLPRETEQSLLLDPDLGISNALYGELIRRGFRRSGDLVYRPHCPFCRQCLSARIPVADFRPRRRHRRVLKANRDLRLVEREPGFRDEHFALYRRYTQARHPGGSMAEASPESYIDFLVADWCDTRFLELRQNDRLLAVAVTDRVSDGLSAVYTFFEPDLPARSLGTRAILAQIERCRELDLPYLYLGYWIRDSEKMRYKGDFRPLEVFSEERWKRFEVGETIQVPELSGP